jgi:hypothetical protein
MRYKLQVDASLGFDLELKSPETAGRGEYKVNPVVLAVETPDGIHCSVVDVDVRPEDSLIRLEFKADGKIGNISLTMRLVDLKCIVESVKTFPSLLKGALKEAVEKEVEA